MTAFSGVTHSHLTELVFQSPEVWLSNPATTEEKIQKYAAFCQRWLGGFTDVGHYPVGPEEAVTPAALLQHLLAAFAIPLASNTIPILVCHLVDDEDTKMAHRELLALQKELGE